VTQKHRRATYPRWAEDNWRLDFIAYTLEKCVPEDKVEREKIVRRSANYVVISNELYRRSASNGVTPVF
jgi:hypothetical protein